jgi:hypothetical protein
MASAGGGVRRDRPAREDPPAKDLTGLLKDNRLQLEFLQARIERLKKDLVRERRLGSMESPRGVEEGAELALKIARARLEKLRRKLAREASSSPGGPEPRSPLTLDP